MSVKGTKEGELIIFENILKEYRKKIFSRCRRNQTANNFVVPRVRWVQRQLHDPNQREYFDR